MARTNKVDQSFSPFMSYTPKFSHNQASDMSYIPDIKNQPCAENTIKEARLVKKPQSQSNEVDQSFSPIMSYKPKFSLNQDFGKDMSYKPQNIEHNCRADEKTKNTNQGDRKDMSYKHRANLEQSSSRSSRSSPDMSYKPKVSSTPRAINTNGVNQAFGADMCYSPDIAENTKLTRAKNVL